MGSFSMICSVSGLGISVGTPVRCMLLTKSPYEDDDPRKIWIVRAPPLRAVYDDYGSIDNVHDDDKFIAELWLRGLREDVVEKGLGDNSCHDVPVAIDMSFDDMLGAIREQRLQVSQDARNFWRKPRSGPGSDETRVPSLMRRVEELLESKFPGHVSRHAEKDKYVVDEPVPHMGRVRFGQYQHGKECTSALEAARTVIEGCGAALTGVIAAGSGRYPDSADLLVFPLPAATDKHVVGPQWDMADDNKPLRIGLAMIREDVWQALIAYPCCAYLSLDCIKCGQSRSYHKANQDCPTASIKGSPYKVRPKDTKYARGSVFPPAVRHVIEPREGTSEYVWYGLDAYKEGTRSTWATVLERFSCRSAGLPATVKDPDAELDTLFEDIREAREKEDARIAALSPEEQEAIQTSQKAQREVWEAEDRRKKEYPFFGDFRIRDVPDFRLPGAWVFRDSTPGVIGVSEHFSMLIADKVAVPVTLLDAVAELSAVRHVLGGVGVVLKPAVSSGPQYPEWGESKRFAHTVLQIAEAASKGREYDIPVPYTLDEAFKIVAKKAKQQKELARSKPISRSKRKTPRAKARRS
jgi:hypothetical protein